MCNILRCLLSSISKMKADNELCANSFNVVTHFSDWSKLSSRRMRAALDNWVLYHFASV
jgi:hypothetical protein